MVMPSNNTGGYTHYLAGRFPGRIGLLMSPGGWRTPPDYMPYAIDNGAFTGFDAEMFIAILAKAAHVKKPLWVIVPDKVGDAEETNRLWHEWAPNIPYKKAFAVQDGHEPQDVPVNADAIFVGGSDKFKLGNGHRFAGLGKWLHIGRVNTYKRLVWADEIGADSVDGTGFFRGPQMTANLLRYLEGKQACLQY